MLLLGSRLMNKFIILMESDEKIGQIKSMYLAFTSPSEHPFTNAHISYIGYTIPIPVSNGKLDALLPMDRAASVGMYTYHTGVDSMIDKTFTIYEEYIIESSEIIKMDKEGIFVTHTGVELSATEIEPGVSFEDVLAMDVVSSEGAPLGSVTDLVLDGTEVVGLELFVGRDIFRRYHTFIPIDKVKNMFDCTIVLDDISDIKVNDIHELLPQKKDGTSR